MPALSLRGFKENHYNDLLSEISDTSWINEAISMCCSVEAPLCLCYEQLLHKD